MVHFLDKMEKSVNGRLQSCFEQSSLYAVLSFKHTRVIWLQVAYIFSIDLYFFPSILCRRHLYNIYMSMKSKTVLRSMKVVNTALSFFW